MRQAIEEGRKPGEAPLAVVASTKTIAPPKPPPGQIRVDLPYESSLSVTGRKVIKVELKNTKISKERADELHSAQNSQTFTMEQELQARIQGTVARKTTINVNFDDTKDNVKDFSVMYKGDPDEVVQEAAFGDITLSLPSTEFVNYSKQLFGIRTALKYKRAGFMAIGSRTKGTTETKRFTGSTERKQYYIHDTEYIRRKYYDLTFAASPHMIGPGGPLNGRTLLPLSDTILEDVFIEDTSGLLQDATNYVVVSPSTGTPNITIRMRRMSRGLDYSVDRLRGIITFNNAVRETDRVAINFALNGGTLLTSLVGGGSAVGVLIKDKTPEDAQVSQEIKRFYYAQSRNITRDNGLGNFIFKIKDKNRENEISVLYANSGKTVRYPDNIKMNFETGIFELENTLNIPGVYDANVSQASPLQAEFSLEYQSLQKTFYLKPNIVLQSEKVEVNGRKLNRDLDYFIDYDIGTITFFNEDLIRESSVIEVTYEFAPFGGQLGETLVGARATYDILTNQKLGRVGFDTWSAGSTVLYNFAPKPTGPPDVRSTPSSMLVTEGDTRLNGIKFGSLPIKTNLTVEAARSIEDPDLYGKAIVDSMEGIKQDDAAPMLKDSWQVSSNPQATVNGFNTNTVSDFKGQDSPASHLRWTDIDFHPPSSTDANTTQRALLVGYDLNTTTKTTAEQVSIINVVSTAGRDFSKKTTLEVEVTGAGAAGKGVNLIVDYGNFNEDADGNGRLDTEDQIPFNGTLDLGEDVGFTFHGPGDDLDIHTTADNINVQVGAGNGRLDTEDLNGNQALDTQDLSAALTPIFDLSQGLVDTQNSAAVSDLSFTGTKLFSIPLNISTLSDEAKARFMSVKQVRITLRNVDPTLAAKIGTVVISRIAMVGNTWEPATLAGTTGSTMTIRAVNNKDDAGVYTPLLGNPVYNDLYKGVTIKSDAKEQALALEYVLMDGSSGTTRNAFSSPRDFSRHENLEFFLSRRDACSGTNCGRFFFQAGSESDYQEASINVADIPQRPNWLVVVLEQKDLNTDGSPETWVSGTDKVTVTRHGASPSLTTVSQLKVGIENATGNKSLPLTNAVWVNEIFVSNSHEKKGNAKRYTFDTSWARWMDMGGTYRTVDRNFQTPTSAITNRDNTQSNMYVNFNRLSFLPTSFKTSREETVTPSAFRTSDNALVSFMDEGRATKVTNSATTKLIVPYFPTFDFSWDNSETKANLTQRTDISDAWRAGATYSTKSNIDILPGKFLTFRPIPTSMTFLQSQKVSKVRFSGLDKLVEFSLSSAPFSSTNLIQTSQESEARLSFRPWDGFSFDPTYRLKVDTEKRRFREDEKVADPLVLPMDNQTTPRSMSQTIAASGNLKLFKWLTPRYNYSLVGTETNDTPTISSPTAYMTKTITRSGSGEVSGTIQISQLLPSIKLFQTLNFNPSYKLEKGDTYSNMPKEFNWRNQLWIGSALTVSTGTLARRETATDRRTFQANSSWLPFGAYQISSKRIKPLSTLSLTNNFLMSTEDQETTGTLSQTKSVSFPDLIVTINDTEDFFGIKKILDNSRLTLKTKTSKSEKRNISRSQTDNYGADYLFQFWKKMDFATNYSMSKTRDNDLVLQRISNKSDSKSYSIQTGVPWGAWRFTPRYDRSDTKARDAIQVTNDLIAQTYTLQIYGDITKPLGLRIGRTELGLANRFILNSTISWASKRSSINPATNYLDTYSASMSGDYTLSNNFRLAIGGTFSQEKHQKDFKKLDQMTFGVNSTLTIQF